MKSRWKKMEIDRRESTQVTGMGDNGKFTLTRTGATVESIEGVR
jgi:hypothetical protein